MLTVETRNSNWTLGAFCAAGDAAARSKVTHERLLFNLTARATSQGRFMRFQFTRCSMATSVRVHQR